LSETATFLGTHAAEIQNDKWGSGGKSAEVLDDVGLVLAIKGADGSIAAFGRRTIRGDRALRLVAPDRIAGQSSGAVGPAKVDVGEAEKG
jgi:hypothetical protein